MVVGDSRIDMKVGGFVGGVTVTIAGYVGHLDFSILEMCTLGLFCLLGTQELLHW